MPSVADLERVVAEVISLTMNGVVSARRQGRAPGKRELCFVIPAKAGIQGIFFWIPTFAYVTKKMEHGREVTVGTHFLGCVRFVTLARLWRFLAGFFVRCQSGC